jgi:hypothetical protein
MFETTGEMKFEMPSGNESGTAERCMCGKICKKMKAC